jgi:hypothetical protein
MLETFIAPSAEQAMHWCLTRWPETQTQTQTPPPPPETPPPGDHPSGGGGDSTPQCFNLETSLSPVSFLNEPHDWSVPFENFSAADILALDLSDWWALKASKGNGGKDVWVVNRHNYAAVLATVPTKDEYILQRCVTVCVCVHIQLLENIYVLFACVCVVYYSLVHVSHTTFHFMSCLSCSYDRYVPRPLLWHKKKFHFRCYCLLRADMSAYMYEKGFIICAGVPYDFTPPSGSSAASSAGSELPDLNKHLTNLSINKTMAGHPGLIPCLMSEECPTVSHT